MKLASLSVVSVEIVCEAQSVMVIVEWFRREEKTFAGHDGRFEVGVRV